MGALHSAPGGSVEVTFLLHEPHPTATGAVMTKRYLILIHRGPEHQEDFLEIAERVRAIDGGISVYPVCYTMQANIPESVWQHPTLTVALTRKFKVPIRRGPVFRNHAIEKLEQQALFRKNGIPTPPALPFSFGMKLDPILFGDFVLLKPMDLKITSTGDGIQLFRRTRAEKLTINGFPSDHHIRKDSKGYLVQSFVDTGERISAFRVTTLFSVPILSLSKKSNVDRPPLGSGDQILEGTPIASDAIKDKMRFMHADDDMVELAMKVYGLLPDVPLLGMDALREASTGRLFGLECNAGGNTRHFSSKSGEKLRGWFGGHPRVPLEKAARKGRQMYISQYGVFHRVAEVLVEKVRSFAS
jgi:hypothetical protein